MYALKFKPKGAGRRRGMKDVYHKLPFAADDYAFLARLPLRVFMDKIFSFEIEGDAYEPDEYRHFHKRAYDRGEGLAGA